MKKLAISTAPGALVVSTLFRISPTAAASGATPRADGSIEIWCDSDATNADGTGPWSVTPGDSAPENGAEDDVLAKRVDATAIQLDKDPGGKDTATERYTTAGLVQGWNCAELRRAAPTASLPCDRIVEAVEGEGEP